MGKRSRRQKKEAMSIMSSGANSNPEVPDKSPKISEEKPCFGENPSKDMNLLSSLTKEDKSSKITSYFPKSPERRLQLAHSSAAAAVAAVAATAAEKEELVAVSAYLPPLGLLTPDTTPTKEYTNPPSRPAHHDQHPAPPHQQPPEVQHSNGERGDRPRAAQKLEYTMTVGEDEGTSDRGSTEGKMGGRAKETDTKRENGKTRRRGRGRSSKPKQAKQVQSPSMTLKDYFPVRRSNRRCKSTIEAEEKKRLHDAILSGQEEGVEVQDILGKGRGVIATRPFKKGDFVVEYHGDHIDINKAKEREQEYATNPNIGCYMYYYQYKNKSYCVDATAESGRIGRLLNHSKTGNCTTRLISIDDRPYLILAAAKSIPIGEELLYDYGDRNKETLQSHPWLAL